MDKQTKQEIIESIKENAVISTSHRDTNIYTIHDKKHQRNIKILHHYTHNLCTAEITKSGFYPLMHTLTNEDSSEILNLCHNAQHGAQTAETYEEKQFSNDLRAYADANSAILKTVRLESIINR